MLDSVLSNLDGEKKRTKYSDLCSYGVYGAETKKPHKTSLIMWDIIR